MTPQTNLEKLQRLLRKLFEFDSAELDFGIYRIMKYKRDVIEKFIEKDLVEAISAELDSGTLAEQSEAVRKLQEVKERILRDFGKDALDGDGNLVVQYRTLPIGKKYLSLKANISGAKARPALEAMIFNHLYTFFRRYYDNGDFMSKHQYSTKKERYAIPYNGEEVHLHWANSDQYYIKTSEYFTDYKFNSKGITVHFKLQNAQVEQDNVKGDKRFFAPLVKEVSFNAKGKQIIIPFEYRPLTQQEEIAYGKRNQQETIITKALEVIPRRFKKNKHALSALLNERRKTAKGESVSYLEHHLGRYTRRNTSDFFIHKDLKGFLERELEFYIKNEVLNLDELEVAGETRAESWFQIMQVIKDIGRKIIVFLTQIENFQKKLFEKKKFVTETNYCIAVGHAPEEFYKEIAANESQWQEWKELFHIDEEQRGLFTQREKKKRRMKFLKTRPTLVLDTCHFDGEFTDRLLASFNDLDEQTDGLLVHGENFQALNLLLERYRKKIKCIYSDQPYNTGSDEFLYKDNYQHSSWITMMGDRLELAKKIMKDDGVIFVSIDDSELSNLRTLMDTIFVRTNRLDRGALIWANKGSTKGFNKIVKNHEYILAYGKCADEVRSLFGQNFKEELGTVEHYCHMAPNPGNPPCELTFKAGCRIEGVKDKVFEGYIGDEVKLKIVSGKMDFKNGVLVKDVTLRGSFPYRNQIEQFFENKGEGIPTYDYKGQEWEEIFFNSKGLPRYRKSRKTRIISSLIDDPDIPNYGADDIKNLFGNKVYSFPKPKELVLHLLKYFSTDGDIVLDFFAGSGTTGHAVMQLNKEDGHKRKFILVEMADYFDWLIVPRIKKIAYSFNWENGKPKRIATREGAEQSPLIIKYIRLESYEDALNNIRFEEKRGQQALQFDDYLLEYMLDWETADNETLLNVEKLTSPFGYKLILTEGQERKEKLVDLPETFNYLLGLHIKTRRVYNDRGRRYLVYRGRVNHGEVVVIWRDTKGWKKKNLERDKKFVAKQRLTKGADEIFINGDSFIPEAKALEPVFKSRMFGGR